MTKLVACLLAALCSAAVAAAAAPDADQPAPSQFNKQTIPGWLDHLGIAGVRTAFPDAQRLYMNTGEGVGGGPAQGSNGTAAIPAAVPAPPKRNVSAVAFADVTGVGRWRTPHPDPSPSVSPINGLSGASPVVMVQLKDGTVLFAERPHGDFRTGQENTLLVDPNTGVGYLGSVYTPSYYNNQPAVAPAQADSFIPLATQSEAFCVGAVSDTNGNAILVGGDNECGDANLVTQCVYRNAYEAQHGIPFPNGYHDVRRYVPGDPNGMSILAHMYDLNSATGQPNTARDCCIQLPNDPTPIDQSCVPDSGCSPRWYPTLMTLPSGNVLIVGGNLVANGGGGTPSSQNPTYQILNSATAALGYKILLPTNLLQTVVPYALYPLIFQLPRTQSILVLSGNLVEVLLLNGDAILGQNRNFGFPPPLATPRTFPTMSGNVILPLSYPNYTPEILIAGGADSNANGLTYSSRLSGIAPGQTAAWTQEDMQGVGRIEGVAVLLPDGTVFLCSGANQGYAVGAWNTGNGYSEFVTAPQIYTPTAPLGSRWTGLLADSGIDRGYHNGALLMPSGEVMVAGSEPTGEYRVQYFVPNYLTSGLPRPAITNAPPALSYNGLFTVDFSLNGDTVARVVLARMCASTHSVQMDQRLLNLYTQLNSPSDLSFLTPPDQTVAPPGFYMLFLVTASGVPSVAKIVQLGSQTATPPATDNLLAGNSLPAGSSLISANNQFIATLQTDGNFVVYNAWLALQAGFNANTALFNSGTSGSGAVTLDMQLDCNLVLYNYYGLPVFNTATYGAGTNPCRLVMQNNGLLSILDATNRVVKSLGSTGPSYTAGMLLSRQKLVQGQQLFAPDGLTYLVAQSDSNLVLYRLYEPNGQTYGNIWQSASNGGSPAPFPFVMQQDCNAVLYNGNGGVLFQTRTAGASAPCYIQVSGALGGSWAVLDSTNSVIYQQPQIAGTLAAGAELVQGKYLYSPDRAVYLVVQADGNLVLYNVAKLNQVGPSNAGAAAVWYSGTYTATGAPFTLVMQNDCNLVLYNTEGTGNPTNAIFNSATSRQGRGYCTLAVSSAGGGFVYIVDAYENVVWARPQFFGTPPKPAPPPPVPAVPPLSSGVLIAGQNLAQGAQLYSPDGAVYFTVQQDGNGVLYSTSRVQQYGQSGLSTIYSTGSTALGTRGSPYTLVMQTDCNLVIYSYGGRDASHAVFNTATYGRGTCTLSVSSANGGTLTIRDQNGNQVWQS